MRDICDRCGREIRDTIFPVPSSLGTDYEFVCGDCYAEICEAANATAKERQREKRRGKV